ncbi:hypothetical protein GQ53DRAFT_744018 [Thozetella sp. PMI_491]|nr:hypothetical protein GQ53DRAFT_744018 [Thozetella sp. PMI_491]
MASPKERLLRWLLLLVSILNLCSAVCILILFVAGSSISGSGHPGNYWLPASEYALVSFSGPIAYVHGGDPSGIPPSYENQNYWFLNSFGWYWPWDEEDDSAGYFYVHPGQPFDLAAAVRYLNKTLTPIASECVSTTLGVPCMLSSPAYMQAIEQHNITVQTGPSFAFYLIALVLNLVMIAGPAFGGQGGPKETRMVGIMALATLCHLIAAGVITGEAYRLLRHLTGLDLNMGATVSRHAILLIWLGGFLATLTAALLIVLRWFLLRAETREQQVHQQSTLEMERPRPSEDILPEYTPEDTIAHNVAPVTAPPRYSADK